MDTQKQTQDIQVDTSGAGVEAADDEQFFDPTEAIADDLQQSYDPEDDILPWNRGAALQARIESTQDLPAADDLSKATGRLTKDIVAGGASAAVGVGNLINAAWTAGARALGQRLTGKTGEELAAENPLLYGDAKAELPDWLKPDNLESGLVQGATQGAIAWTGLGIASKLAEGLGAITGISGAVQNSALATKLGQLGEQAAAEYPHLTRLAQTTMEAIKLQGADAVVNFTAFDGHQGNIMNLVQDMADGNASIVGQVSRYISRPLAVQADDNEFEARLKNSITGLLGNAGATAIMSAAKIARAIRRVKESGESQAITEGLRQIQAEAANLESAASEVFSDTQETLDYLMAQPAADATEAVVPHPMDSRPPVVIEDEDTIGDFNTKYYGEGAKPLNKRIAEQRRAALEMAAQRGKQSIDAFDWGQFQESIGSKFQAGEPVVLHEELIDALKDVDITDIPKFQKHFRKVINATTTQIKRYVSNPEQVNTAKRVLSEDIGDAALRGELNSAIEELITKGADSVAAVRQATLDMVGLKMMEKVLAHKVTEELAAFHDAKLLGATGRKSQAAALVNQYQETFMQADSMRRMLASEAGRMLQATQINPSDGDSVDLVKQILKRTRAAADAGSRRPLSEDELGAAAAAANEFIGIDGGSVTTKGAKHTMQWLKALQMSGHLGLSVVRDTFYNAVLSGMETLKNIGWGNFINRNYDSATTIVGSIATANDKTLATALDDAVAFWRYQAEGAMGGLKVLATGQRSKFDHAPILPRTVSADGLRQQFGASYYDLFPNKVGRFADQFVDKLGSAVNFSVTRVIGGIDTVMKVSNFRAVTYSELKSIARGQGIVDEKEAERWVQKHLGTVTEDIIRGRATNFHPRKTGAPASPLTLEQLETINQRIVGRAEHAALAHPLEKASDPYYHPGYEVKTKGKRPHQYTSSDRWAFQVMRSFDSTMKKLGLIGTEMAPFTGTFINSAQQAADNIPLLNTASPHFRARLRGEYGPDAQSNAWGKLILGAALATSGICMAKAGVLAPVAGSVSDKKQNKALTGQDTYTIHLDTTEWPEWSKVPGTNGVTLNLQRGAPLVDAIFLPARLYQIGFGPEANTMDGQTKLYASIVALSEAFGSGRMLKGLMGSVDSLVNPSYSTPDNFYRNVVLGFSGSVATPGGRINDSLTRFTDPYYRDFTTTGNYFQDLQEYAKSRMVGLSNSESPVYDYFGNPRPRDDYVGDTLPLAVNIAKLVSSVGIKYTVDDPLALELARLGRNGQALTPPKKTLSIEGIKVPIDKFTDSTGKSLWDVYNENFAKLTPRGRLSVNYNGDGTRNVRETMNALINSEDWAIMHDSVASKVAGTRNIYVGSRWTALYGIYAEAKEEVESMMFGGHGMAPDEHYFNNFSTPDGKTLREWIEQEMTQKEHAAADG